MSYTPPIYPGAIPTITDLFGYTNDIDWMTVDKWDAIRKELNAVLDTLGVNPQGAYATVVERLNAGGGVDEKVKADAGDPTAGYLDAKIQNSIENDATAHAIQLKNDEASPGNSKVYGTTGAGVKGWVSAPSGSKIQDADGDTKVDTEESADEDHVRMDVAGVEAFDLNTDGILTLAKNSVARAYRSGYQSIATGGPYKIGWNAKNIDIQNEFDITTNHRYTAKEAGEIVVTINELWAYGEAGGFFVLYIYKNGAITTQRWFYSYSHSQLFNFISDTIEVAKNDYIETYVYNGQAGAELTGPSSDKCYIAIRKTS